VVGKDNNWYKEHMMVKRVRRLVRIADYAVDVFSSLSPNLILIQTNILMKMPIMLKNKHHQLRNKHHQVQMKCKFMEEDPMICRC
jgi:hypothetical protein